MDKVSTIVGGEKKIGIDSYFKLVLTESLSIMDYNYRSSTVVAYTISSSNYAEPNCVFPPYTFNKSSVLLHSLISQVLIYAF